MPAKIVYGKKKSQQQTSFTRLLSPEKASATVAEGSSDTATGTNWRVQLGLAAQTPHVRGGDATTAVIDSLASGLGALKIQGDADDRNQDGRIHGSQSKSKGKRRNQRERGTEEKHGRKAKGAAALIEERLERSMGQLLIGGSKEEEPTEVEAGVTVINGQKMRVGRPRKALDPRDGNAVRGFDSGQKSKSDERKWSGKSNEGREEVEPIEESEVKTHVEMAPTARSTSPADATVHTPGQTPKKSPKAKRRMECTPTARPESSQLLTPEPTPDPDDIYAAYISPLLSLSDRKSLRLFTDWTAELSPHFQITKIAEASFSEVYRLSSISGIKAESVLKVVALKTPPSAPFPCQWTTRAVRDRNAQLLKEQEERDERDQYKSHVGDVLSEVKLLQNLTPIPGFTLFRSLSLVRGRPPAYFTSAWHAWNRSRPRGKKSEFPDPSKKSSYDDTQLWAVIEMQDAGTDCEKLMEAGSLKSVWEVWDVFWGVACSVAKAEEGVRFEHRDLHLGNICVRGVGGGAVKDLMAPRIKEPLKRKMRFCELETTVIDYTLSRADIVSHHGYAERSPGETLEKEDESDSVDVAYLDLNADPALFEGDASEEYQYEIYRYMRGVALFGSPLQWESCLPAAPEPTAQQETEQGRMMLTPKRSPKKNTHIRFDGSDDETVEIASCRLPQASGALGARKQESEPLPPPTVDKEDGHDEVWKAFHPQTNLVWLHFLLHKLLTHMKLHNSIPTMLSPQQLSADVVPSSSNAELLDVTKIKKKALKLYKVLERVSELLCPVALGREGALGSAKELVVKALEERWIRVGDVEG
ncbi:hypothetical protein T440DRAFT_471062 [Plenodomus tracheiphilus IPT5]|uniref:non-specific serine/threonine protein kinase n=1 Tax=Plenodomus tracheiphilus IPT5 TaxID=1408161 RepID=A0A6A7AX13_9PLEO|nr:hypothetical protein T440DRAFT_471062 [Plenodomus tracheiphilus IPT5]